MIPYRTSMKYLCPELWGTPIAGIEKLTGLECKTDSVHACGSPSSERDQRRSGMYLAIAVLVALPSELWKA